MDMCDRDRPVPPASSELSVSVTKRQIDSRRRFMPVHFPLMDSEGSFVFRDRRQSTDRRKRVLGLDDLKTILSKIYSD